MCLSKCKNWCSRGRGFGLLMQRKRLQQLALAASLFISLLLFANWPAANQVGVRRCWSFWNVCHWTTPGKLDFVNYAKLRLKVYEDMLTLTCCQDHNPTKNIWFVWSETSYSGDEKRCYRCVTNNKQQTTTEDRATQPMEAGGWVSQFGHSW